MAPRRPDRLTDEAVKNLALSPGQLFADPWTPNLFVRGGKRSKTWIVVVRQPNGKQKWVSVGKVDKVTVAAAQAETARIVERVRAGEPKETTSATVTFTEVTESYQVTVGRHHRRKADKKRRLDRWLLRVFGKRAFLDIKRGEVNGLLNEIAEKSTRVADQVLADLQAIEKHFLSMKQCPDDYEQRFRGGTIAKRATPNPRERTLSPEEVRVIWTLAGGADRFGVIVRLLLLTGQRLQKVLSMQWTHLNPDTGEWRIHRAPREKGAPEVLMLPPQALTLIKSQLRLGDYVFGSVRGNGHMVGLSELKRAFEVKVRAQLPKIERWTLHDLRRTHRTLLSKLKVDFFTGEMILGHKLGGVAAVYQRDDFAEEIPAALAKLADRVETIAAGSEKQAA